LPLTPAKANSCFDWGNTAATAHLDGEVLPGDAGLEDKEDAGQRLAVVEGFAAGVMATTTLRGWEQRLDEVPQFIRNKGLRHDNTSFGHVG